MVDKLYGDDNDLGERVFTEDDTEYGTKWASKTFKKLVKSRIEIRNNYCFYLFFWIKTSMCCCFRNCCNRFEWIRKGTVKYRKFLIALERLSKEQDI